MDEAVFVVKIFKICLSQDEFDKQSKSLLQAPPGFVLNIIVGEGVDI